MAKGGKQRGRLPSVVVRPGMKFGHLTIVQKVNTKSAGNSWRCECVCGTRVTVRQHYLLRPVHPKTSCGCKTYENANPFKRERTIWQMMNRRCLYSDHVSYKYYGALGIRPCARWIETNPDGFKNFMEDMGPAPSMAHTLERLNPFEGYAPLQTNGERQCVWATMTEQANNKRSHWLARNQRMQRVKAQLEAEKAKEDG